MGHIIALFQPSFDPAINTTIDEGVWRFAYSALVSWACIYLTNSSLKGQKN